MMLYVATDWGDLKDGGVMMMLMMMMMTVMMILSGHPSIRVKSIIGSTQLSGDPSIQV